MQRSLLKIVNVLLTRALSQVKPLKSLVRKNGYQPILFPTLTIEPLTSNPQKTQYDALIFISANAVEYAKQVLKNITYNKIFAVGAATAKKLEQQNIKVDAFPTQKSSSEALLAMDEIRVLSNQSILIFRGKGGKETLREGLEQNNSVEYIEVYQRTPCDITPLHRNALQIFLQNEQGIITATSVENLNALMSLTKQINIGLITQYPLVVLSERIKIVAQSLGFTHIEVATETRDSGLLNAIQTIL